jgi:hypothetical protein
VEHEQGKRVVNPALLLRRIDAGKSVQAALDRRKCGLDPSATINIARDIAAERPCRRGDQRGKDDDLQPTPARSRNFVGSRQVVTGTDVTNRACERKQKQYECQEVEHLFSCSKILDDEDWPGRIYFLWAPAACKIAIVYCLISRRSRPRGAVDLEIDRADHQSATKARYTSTMSATDA